MEILKGKVQDPGFPDTEITYLKTDDGKTYFFIENGTLKNGNYIATPNLKEGIGHAPYTSLGVITPDGNILIPFENKNVQVLSNELLLVERNTPVTESVVSALQKQNDPLSASELIESANTIKNQIISVMGSNGNFIFDNQFSEAALYTTDGVNLANNYFSFIGAKDGAYFMSQNVVGSPIAKYDPYAFAMENEQQEQKQESNPQGETSEENQDVSTENNQELANSIPSVEDSQVQQEENKSSDVENTDNNQVQQDIPLTPELPQNEALTPEISMPNVDNQEKENEQQENAIESTDATDQDTVDINIPLFSENLSNENDANENNDTNGDDIEQDDNINSSLNNETEDNESSLENSEEDSPKLNISIENEKVEQPENENPVEESINEEEIVSDSEENQDEYETSASEENDESNLENNKEEYEDENSEPASGGGEELSDDEYQSEDEKYYEENLDNPIIANATDTIKKLLEENRKQRQQLDQQESELYTLKTNNEILQEDNMSKTQEINSLRRVHETDRKNNIDLLRENNKLKAESIRRDEIIDNLKQQNSALKEQVAGISALNSAVMEANTLFGNDGSSEYGYLDDSNGYQYQKAA